MATPTPAALAVNVTVIATFGAATATSPARKLLALATNDTQAQFQTAGYLNPVAAFVDDGDLIMVAGDLDGTKWSRTYIITKPASGDITVTAQAVS